MTPVWDVHVLPEIEQRIEVLRMSLEKPALSPEKTEFVRGQIHALRQLAALPDDLKRKADRRQA